MSTPWIKANTIESVLKQAKDNAEAFGTDVLDELVTYREHVIRLGWDERLAEAASAAMNIVRLDDSLDQGQPDL